MGAFFYIPARSGNSLSVLHNSFTFIIADYNLKHKLLAQLRTLKTVTYDIKQKVLWVLPPLKNLL